MTERQQRAQEFHGKGYNCAQSVVCAYADLVGLDEQTAYKMAEGFGLGMGVMELCGALSGAFMLAGVKGSAGHHQGADLPYHPRNGERLQGEERHLPVPRAQGRHGRQRPPQLPRLHRGRLRSGRENAGTVKRVFPKTKKSACRFTAG